MSDTVHPSAVGIEFRRPICPKGHDKRITGVGPHRFCRICRNAAVRARDRKARREAGVDPVNPARVPALRYWRLERDVTQRQLADRAGVTKETIIALEFRGRPAHIWTRRALASALGVTPGDLVLCPPGEPKKKRAGYGPRKKVAA